MEWISRECVLCHSKNFETVAEKDRSGAPLTTVICKGCGLVFVNPVPVEKETEHYYAHEYRQFYKGLYQPKTKHVYRSGTRALERIRFLKKMKLPAVSTLLDVGSGGGEFVYLLNRLGMKASGLEPHEGYASFSREVLGIPVTNEAFRNSTLLTGTYDAVTLHHVLEHFWDPFQAFDISRKLLRPGGLLIIEVPNILAAYHAPSSQFHTAHLFHFSPKTLEAAGKKAGFQLQHLELAPYHQHVRAVFKKTETMGTGPWENPASYEEVIQKIRRHSVFAHYLSVHPYWRPLNNIFRTLREAVVMAGKKDYKKILDDLVRGMTYALAFAVAPIL